MRFKPHSQKQFQFLHSKKRMTIAATGIQWGKSYAGVMRLVMDIFRHTDKTDNFIVTSPTYKILYQSTMPVFLNVMGDYGKPNKEHEFFQVKGGGKVWFRTGQNPDSVVGITNVRHILCDEAGLYSLYFWENIQARSSIKACPISIVTSPYSLNWLYNDYIRKYNAKDPFILDQCLLIQARSDENPYFPAQEYLDKQKTMDPRRLNMVYGGSFDKAQGLVYDCFDRTIMMIDPIKLPTGTRFFGGIDWGYTDPTCIRIRAVTEEGMHYGVDEVYESQLHQADILEHCARLKMLWNVEKFVADPSRPDHISFLNQHGITTIGAQNDIQLGIERHYQLIKSGYYQLFKNSNRHAVDEYETYHYPEPADLKPNQSQKSNINLPVDQNNHAMDVERYITMMTHSIGYRKNRVANDSESLIKASEVSINYDTRLEKLKRRRRNANVSI